MSASESVMSAWGYYMGNFCLGVESGEMGGELIEGGKLGEGKRVFFFFLGGGGGGGRGEGAFRTYIKCDLYACDIV